MSIEASKRATPGVYSQSAPIGEAPSGTIEGLFYTKDGSVIKIDYTDFVQSIRVHIIGEAENAFRRRLAEQGAPDITGRFPSMPEIEGAIYQNFDHLAVNSLTTLFSSLKHNNLPQNVVFTTPERPYTPWEGRVQEWLAGCRQPLEATGGMYGMYRPEEYPQLHFQRPDGTEF